MPQTGPRVSRRDEIRKRLDAATPGPWEASEYTEGDPTGTGEGYALLEVRAGGEFIAGLDGDDEDRRDDADLIAHAPSDLRDLLAVADAAAQALWDKDSIGRTVCSWCLRAAYLGCRPECPSREVRAALSRLDGARPQNG